MAHKLKIHKLGPILDCEMELGEKQLIVLTGCQASGKSTIAKAVYFFRSLKEDTYRLLQRWASENHVREDNRKLSGEFERMVRNKFLDTFGTSYNMDPEMELTYQYAEGCELKIVLEGNKDAELLNYVWVDYSKMAVRELLERYASLNAPMMSDRSEILKRELAGLFHDPFEMVFIPAGRSLFTVLGDQLIYLYTMMDDDQKRRLDSCTRDYLLRAIGLREGVSDLWREAEDRDKEEFRLAREILKGSYRFSQGEERILIDEKRYVKMNFASSGQQEAIWILNLLLYYSQGEGKSFFIIEEPESNLFPESQKKIMEWISFIIHKGHCAILTTHSPYVLGTVNNLLYAADVGKIERDRTKELIPEAMWLDYEHCDAFFVRDEKAESCMDGKMRQIDSSLLDEISNVINQDYDKLFEMEREKEVGEGGSYAIEGI